jgi:hypothetical protein
MARLVRATYRGMVSIRVTRTSRAMTGKGRHTSKGRPFHKPRSTSLLAHQRAKNPIRLQRQLSAAGSGGVRDGVGQRRAYRVERAFTH